MELNGQQHIGAPRQKVWEALNDPLILSRCVPGCEEIVAVSDTEKHARVLLKIGPVRARFAGKIFMSDVVAPTRCTLSFEGSGGAAGFAKGSSQVSLAEEAGGTALHYTVEASVGGKLGQIGGRLIDASAKKMADEFFTAFNAALTQPEQPAEVAPASAVTGNVATRPSPSTAQRPLQPSSFGHSIGPELVRVFWFSFGAAFTLLISRWAA